MRRTMYCGALRESDIGRTVTAVGWVQTKRDMGGVIFIDLRDRAGTLQVVCSLERVGAAGFALAEALRNQSVVEVTGQMCLRDAETVNARLLTGTIELRAQVITLLSVAAALPFSLDDDAKVREDLRMQYRYLDIRRPVMQERLRFRHLVSRAARDYLDNDGFVEVETPVLTKSTPEGARDYLVPSRVHPGRFYALPQSPQIFKQLLMVGGVDKYYQIARCFRDEDLRADRQPEFTQVDMEMSFVEQEDVLEHLEKLFRHIYQQAMGCAIQKPFLRMTWTEAMDRYGSDKPDLRFDLPIVDLSALMKTCSFSVFRSVMDKGGAVRAINARGCGDIFTRSMIEELTEKAIGLGAKGMAWILLKSDGEINSILSKYFSEEQMRAILQAMGAENGDFIFFCADALSTVRRTLGALRLEVADMLGLRDKNVFQFLFVTDFPQFEYSQEEKRFMAMHHPFTMPYEDDIPYLKSDPARVRAQAYDVVLNGVELGSGSIRIHRADVQQAMFQALGFADEEIEERFGFMVGAFQYGTPPHGGFAFGLDRLVMLLLGADSLRDVIAFPKTKDATCLMTDAPGRVDAEQLEALHLGEGLSPQRSEGKARGKAKIDAAQVETMAELAKLRFRDDEKKALAEEMSDMIAFFDKLGELDTQGVEPTAHVVPLENIFREDVVRAPFNRDALLASAPTKQRGYIQVPRVVE